jgi:hypothetical protein
LVSVGTLRRHTTKLQTNSLKQAWTSRGPTPNQPPTTSEPPLRPTAQPPQPPHHLPQTKPKVAASVVHLLMDFLGDASTSAALDVVFFVREMCETHPALVPSVLERLRDNFATIRASRVCTCALWVLSEYSSSVEEVRDGGCYCFVGGVFLAQAQHLSGAMALLKPTYRHPQIITLIQQVRAALDTIKEGLGPLPLLPPEADEEPADDAEAKDNGGATGGAAAKTTSGAPAGSVGSKRPAVLADGTYATQAAVQEAPLASAAGGAGSVPNLRALLLGGDFFLGGVVAAALTKLALRLRAAGVPRAAANRASATAMLLVASVLRLGEWSGLPSPLDDDSRERMSTCLEVLARPEPEMVKVRPGAAGWGGGGVAMFVSALKPPPQPQTLPKPNQTKPPPAVAGPVPRRLHRPHGRQAEPRGRRRRRAELQGRRAAGRPDRLYAPARAQGGWGGGGGVWVFGGGCGEGQPKRRGLYHQSL